MSEPKSRQQIVREALEKAAKHFHPDDPRNDITLVSDILDVSEQYIYKWIRKGEVPGKWAAKIDRLTYGSVSRAELNPSLFR